MPFSRRSAAVVALVLASPAGFAATRAAGAQEDHHPANARPVPGLVTAGRNDSTQRLIHRTPTRRPGDPELEASGTISIAVPVVPSLQALPGLCTAFLKSNSGSENGSVFQVLIGATGGNAAATTAWCETYLTLWQEGKTGQR